MMGRFCFVAEALDLLEMTIVSLQKTSGSTTNIRALQKAESVLSVKVLLASVGLPERCLPGTFEGS
jgi:hypothetical protein